MKLFEFKSMPLQANHGRLDLVLHQKVVNIVEVHAMNIDNRKSQFDEVLSKIPCLKGIDKYVKTVVRGFRTMIKQKFIIDD